MKSIINLLEEASKNVRICRSCRNLCVLGTGSQIILICKITKRFKSYDEPCDCNAYQQKSESIVVEY